MKYFFKIFLSELQKVFRNHDILLMVLGAPILYGVVLSFAYTQGRVENVPVAVVAQDSSAFTQNLLRQIDATEEVALTDSFTTIPEATHAIKNGDNVALLYVPKNFTKRRLRLQASPLYLATNTSNFALSNPAMVGTATVTQTFGAGTLMALMRKTGQTKEKAFNLASPIALDTRQIFNPLLNYSFFFVPGLIYAILQQIILVGLCFSLTEEKDRRVWQPPQSFGMVAPYIVGRCLPYALINLLFSLAYIYILLPWIHLNVSYTQLGLITVFGFAFVFASSAMAFLFGLLFKDSVTAIVALMFYSMPAFLISGMSWPSFNLSLPLKILSWFTPITHFGEAIRRILLEPEVGFQHVLTSFLNTLLFAIVVVGVCIWILVRNKADQTKLT
ncbi:ABC transporter permease [Bdellovibrio sp. NC01]|uniref:ABC transporter permease n=1 Tax=Bdellovibrio sp. NC01 TaxID=2220073 RepID=UPI00143CF7F3|nr:ABC transporter permease [Bdellovibrio sp. NC01]